MDRLRRNAQIADRFRKAMSLALGQAFVCLTQFQSRVLSEQGALFRPARICIIHRGWQATVVGGSCEGIRAMHMAGPAPSGDNSKGGEKVEGSR